jgi:hydroxymethylbilane synthase
VPSFTYATRKSALALAQSRAFVDELGLLAPEASFAETQVVTTGDRIQDRPLAEVGGKGLFVKEIEEALLSGAAHFAVHSMKDVPYKLPDGLALSCIPKREDPRDVVVSKYESLAALPKGAKVGTSSLRRALALKRARPDLDCQPVRGNVDTRLRKVDEGQYDAIVLARAGLNRLGLGHRATFVLEVDVCLPAAGQGALGIESPIHDVAINDILQRMNDPETAIAVLAERGVLLELEGDCKTPIAAHAVREGGEMRLRAYSARVDGTHYAAKESLFPWPAEAAEATARGRELARTLRV